jgi:hypothetical protein
MCFFEQTRWACGFWQWGTFREQCSKEYRTGETCGLKLVYLTDCKVTTCGLCRQIDRKRRRISKMATDIERWTREGNRKATIEKTNRDITELSSSISILQQRHFERGFDLTAPEWRSQRRSPKTNRVSRLQHWHLPLAASQPSRFVI